MALGPKFELKTPEQIIKMRAAGLVVQHALAEVAQAAVPGVTTRELDAIAAGVLTQHAATSSFYGYGADWGLPPFPGVTCISVNDEIVHGIPGDRVLTDGDLVSVDFGAIVDGWHGDAAITISVGEVSPEAQALSDTCRAALWAGIGAARIGGRLNDVGGAIEDVIEGARCGYGIVEEYTGHGIGTSMHMDPDVLNYRVRGRTPKIEEGLVIAIEPMVTLGSAETRTLADEWTVVTADHSLASHWEHTMTVTKHGVWVLTAEDGGEAELTRLGVPFGPLAD